MRLTPFVGALSLLVARAAFGQELEPRSYSPAPIGTTIVLGGVGGSQGAILLDPSLDISDVQADLKIVTAGFGYTFALGGRQARLLVVAPMAWGTIGGDVHQSAQSQPVAGLVDPRIKLSVALRGAPALTLGEFAKAPRRTVVGASVTVMPPVGQYDATRLVNLGYHRWAFKPEMGISRTLGRWTVDAYAGAWFFTTNTAYFPGRARREQDAIASVQGHVSYALPHRMWLAFDATGFSGGETRVDGQLNPDLQRNSRLGCTLSIPVGRQQSLKFVYSTGSRTRRGSDFDTINVTWQLVKF
jgi:hypothetical protein